MKKTILLVVVFCLTLMFGTTALAEAYQNDSIVSLSAQEKIDIEKANNFLKSQGLESIPVDAIGLMNQSSKINQGISDWDIIVRYLTTGRLPENVSIKFGDGTVEISYEKFSINKISIFASNIVFIPMTTYTVWSNSASGIQQSLDIGSGTLSAFTGNYYWTASYTTTKPVNVVVNNPVSNVSWWDYSNNGTTESNGGNVCSNPPTGSWHMIIYCSNPGTGSTISGALMRQN